MSHAPTIAIPRPQRLLAAEQAVDELTRVYRLAWSLCGSHQLAEDVTQETYARVLARPRRMRRNGDFPYLARTLRNVLHDHWRSEQRRPATTQVADAEIATPDGDPETAAFAGEVYAAVAELPEPLRDVVAAVDVAGMTYGEAARSLRIPPGTVMSRLHRARARLAGTLGVAA
jgi:RNA polymerase sigma-70 factor, ECF subfamily